jgi:hypothetical protein
MASSQINTKACLGCGFCSTDRELYFFGSLDFFLLELLFRRKFGL